MSSAMMPRRCWLVVPLLLLGLLWMHGTATHGGHAPAHAADTAQSQASGPGAPTSSGAPPSSALPLSAAAHDDADVLDLLVGLCLALLGVALARALARPPSGRFEGATTVRADWTPRRSRNAEPPDLTALGILRC